MALVAAQRELDAVKRVDEIGALPRRFKLLGRDEVAALVPVVHLQDAIVYSHPWRTSASVHYERVECHQARDAALPVSRRSAFSEREKMSRTLGGIRNGGDFLAR